MKLSALLVVYHLRDRYPLRASARLGREPLLCYATLYRNGQALENGRIYIADQSDFVMPSHHLQETLVILTGADFTVSEADYPNLCILPAEVTADEVLQYLQEIFLRYEQWNQSLIDSRLKNSSIQNLLDLTEVVIPNPMMLIGMDFTIIATKKIEFSDLTSPVLGSSESTREIIDSLKMDPNYEAAYYEQHYFYFPGNETAYPSLCVNLMSNQHTVYRLMITEGGVPLDDTFGFVLEYLAEMVSHALSTGVVRSFDTAYPMHRIFSTLLTDPGADYVEISQRLSELGWLSSQSYLCLVVLTGLIDQKNLTLRSICSYIENTLPASCAVELRGNAVVYINLDLAGLGLEEISHRLSGFIQSSMLNLGVSRRMLGHFNFQRQYVQAMVALHEGKRKNPMHFLHPFNAIALDYILEQTTNKLPAYMICHEPLLQLKYEDEANHSHLYETLRCYLEHHQSITQTAEALYIHRSTLLYRLDKIKAQLNTDFSDSDELLYLLLSFHLMEKESR